MQRLQRLTAEAGEWARDYRARQRATAAAAVIPSLQQGQQQQQQQGAQISLRMESPADAPIAALAAYTQSGLAYTHNNAVLYRLVSGTVSCAGAAFVGASPFDGGQLWQRRLSTNAPALLCTFVSCSRVTML